jgi:hypothetical protein
LEPNKTCFTIFGPIQQFILDSQVGLEANFEIALENEKTGGNQIWPGSPTAQCGGGSERSG